MQRMLGMWRRKSFLRLAEGVLVLIRPRFHTNPTQQLNFSNCTSPFQSQKLNIKHFKPSWLKLKNSTIFNLILMLRTEPNLYTVVANFIFRCQTIHNRDLGTVEVLDFFPPSHSGRTTNKKVDLKLLTHILGRQSEENNRNWRGKKLIITLTLNLCASESYRLWFSRRKDIKNPIGYDFHEWKNKKLMVRW